MYLYFLDKPRMFNLIQFSNFWFNYHIKVWKQIKITKFFTCSLLHSPSQKHFLIISPKSLDGSSPLHSAQTHTQLHKSQEYAESQQWMDWHLSDYLVHWPPNNSNQLYVHSTSCACRCVTRRHFSLNALFHKSQAYRCSPLCMQWCPIKLIFPMNALLHTSQLHGRSH